MRDRERPVDALRRKHHDELLAAKASDNIDVAHGVTQNASEEPQRRDRLRRARACRSNS